MDVLRERLLDLATEAPTVEGVPPALAGRARRRIARNVIAGVAVVALILAGSVEALRASERPSPTPASPSPSLLPRSMAELQRWIDGARGQVVVEHEGGLLTVDPSSGTPDEETFSPGGVPLSWSRDGGELLISTQHGLEVLRRDGTRTAVGQTHAWGTWGTLSPDGSMVVFPARHGLKVASTDGGASIVLTTSDRKWQWFHDPSWSPDGARIAFVTGARAPNTLSIAVMDADGSDQRVLFTPEGRVTELSWIAWSPDGTRLAFAVNHCKLCARIWTMDADGSNLRKLTFEDSISPVWSPDGSRIAFIDADGMVATMSPDGSDIVRTTTPGSGPYLTWNPVPTPA